MTRCLCLVQQDQTPEAKRAQLQQGLQRFSEGAFGQAADITWISVPAGSGFTAAAPSTSSIVSFTADQPIEQDERVSLLGELCDLWMQETGCSLAEIVAVISDPRAV